MTENRRFRAPDGTQDILPDRIPLWLRVEETVRRVCVRYGYQELRTPDYEHTDLFHKSTGETTDIVEKQMFTFGAGGKYALRPEVTPSVVRVLIEQNLHKQKGFWKFFYFGPAFRHERPQKGRYRQFHQLGVEAIGSHDPMVDAETILVFHDILRELDVRGFSVRINTLGCTNCRGEYRDVLREAVRPNLPKHCENCRRRFGQNLFRILDCKVEGCVALTRDLPKVTDHVCADCRAHFAKVEESLQAAELDYVVDPLIVRGLDYYTRTVYEFLHEEVGAQSAIGGGGRYDTLVSDMGGPELGSVGFASGVERVLLAMEASGVRPSPVPMDFYVVAVGDESRPQAFLVANRLRRAGLAGDLDFEGRSLKAQMRSANRAGARYALILGKSEIESGTIKLKEMASGEESEVAAGEIEGRLKGGKP